MRVLVIEDDRDLCGLIETNLKEQGYVVDTCHDGQEGLRLLRQRAHDVCLLDRMLPGLDGLAVLGAARREGVNCPVILVTALGGSSQVVEGLDTGADDYLVKPFAVGELLARVRAAARRPAGFAASDEIRLAGGVVLHPTDKLLEGPAGRASLSGRECHLLELLGKNAGKTLPRGTIFSHVWGPDAPVEDANLDNYIHFVRGRLREVGAPWRIVTLRGVGYRLEQTDV